eukprot:2195924-Rhodomonas_salina.4
MRGTDVADGGTRESSATQAREGSDAQGSVSPHHLPRYAHAMRCPKTSGTNVGHPTTRSRGCGPTAASRERCMSASISAGADAIYGCVADIDGGVCGGGGQLWASNVGEGVWAKQALHTVVGKWMNQCTAAGVTAGLPVHLLHPGPTRDADNPVYA